MKPRKSLFSQVKPGPSEICLIHLSIYTPYCMSAMFDASSLPKELKTFSEALLYHVEVKSRSLLKSKSSW